MDTKTDGEDAAPDFLTAAEVATWLRVGLSTVYAWTARDQSPLSGSMASCDFSGVSYMGGCSSTRCARPRRRMYLKESPGLILAN